MIRIRNRKAFTVIAALVVVILISVNRVVFPAPPATMDRPSSRSAPSGCSQNSLKASHDVSSTKAVAYWLDKGIYKFDEKTIRDLTYKFAFR
jgi:competence protein ComGC